MTEQFPGAADGPVKTGAEIIAICDELASMPPQFGRCRVAEAESTTRLTVNVIELLASSIGEQVFFPHLSALDAKHDEIDARALADAIAVAPDAVVPLLAYCASEARGLIVEY